MDADGNLKEVDFILNNCNDTTDVNKADANNRTALIWAADMGHFAIVELLLKQKDIEVNLVDKDKITALFCGSERGHSEVVVLLLKHPQIDVDQECWWLRISALYRASHIGQSKVVSLLIRHPQIDVNKWNQGATALHAACSYNQTEVVRVLVNHPQIDVNKPTKRTFETALSMAHRYGHVGVTRLLLSHPEIDVLKGLTNSNGFMEAGKLIFGSENLTNSEKFLISTIKGNLSGALEQLEYNDTHLDINIADERGMTALIWASKSGYFEIVKFLLNIPTVAINQERKSDGLNALMLAAYNGHSDVVEILLNQSNLEIAKRSFLKGNNALSMASEKGHIVVVRQLIAKKQIIINDVNTNGESSLYKASQNGYFSVVQMLLHNKDIDINKASIDRITPLMASAKGWHFKIVEILLSKPNIMANFANYEGKTALFLSIPINNNVDQNKLKDLLELLLRCPSLDITHLDEYGNQASDYAVIAGFLSLTYLFEAKSHAMIKRLGHTCCSDNANSGLQIAARQGDLKMVKAFILCPEVDLNNGYKFDITPLYMASSRNHSSLVDVLLNDPRINVNVEVNSCSALYTAAENGNSEVVKLLLNHPDIDVNKANRRNQMSVLMIAVEKGLVNIVRLLIDHPQTDVNIIDAKDNTAISIASKWGSLKIVKLILRCPKVHVNNLLKKDADYHGPNMNEILKYHTELAKLPTTCCLDVGETLLKSAWIGDFRGIRGLLMCPDIDINVVDKKGRTPLYLASWLRHLKVIEILLKDPNIDVNKGMFIDQSTPFVIASKKGYFDIMEKLINHENVEEGKGWTIDCWAPDSSSLSFLIDTTATPSTNEITTSRGQKVMCSIYYTTVLFSCPTCIINLFQWN